MKSSYHFIGIGGIGMSAIAKILLEKNSRVKGSDIKSNWITEQLKKKGAQIYIGHNEDVVKENDIIVISSAIDERNTEFKKAKKLNLKILHRSQILDKLMQNKKRILITGSHGKTTTSSLLTEVFFENQQDPSFVIGGILNSKKTNGYHGNDNYFIAEADESDGSFIRANADIAIVTNLESEHLTYWKTFTNLKKGFLTFFEKVKNKDYLFWCWDDQNLSQMKPKGISYGFSVDADLTAENIRFEGFQTIYDIKFFDKTFKDVKINLIGEHNVLNSLAVFGLCLQLKIDEKIIRQAFIKFSGSSRRLEKILESQKTIFFDDYAHHPTEIKATLQSLRKAIKERRLVCIFQPHRYSRIKDLFDQFVESFDVVDELIITNIYAASEKPIDGINEKLLVNKIQQRQVNVKYIPDHRLENYICENVITFDVVIALGAGDISSTIRKIANNYAKKPKKLQVGIIFGGCSNEHEISIKSTKNYIKGFDKTLFDLKYFKITKEGNWIFDDMKIPKSEKIDQLLSSKVITELRSCDVCFPILHGPMGEDGMIPAFLQTLKIPYIGCDYFTASIAMDKAFCKTIVKSIGVLTLDFVEIIDFEWQENSSKFIKKILDKFQFPLYVKPNHLGSSLGIKVAKNKNELVSAIDYAFNYDSSLIVEERLPAQELQTAVIGNECLMIGEVGEMLTKGEFFNYENKYEKSLVTSNIPMKLTQKKRKEICNTSIEIYKTLKLNGFARIDLFLDKKKKVYFNEVNPVPGFSSNNSLFPKMLEFIGIDNVQMIENFVIYALHRNRKNKMYERVLL